MALSIEEMRKRSLQKARAQDEQKAQITARVVSNTKEGRYKAEKQQPQASAYPKETIQAVSQAARKPFSVNQLTDIFQSGTMQRPALDVERPKVETQKPAEKVTAIDWLGSKAGQFNRGITGALDVVANAIPIAEGALFGVDKDATFTGQLLKPLTTATGKLHEWTSGTTDALNQKVDTAIGDNKALKIASDVGGGVITALPNAALALMSGGTSVPAQLGAQGTGLAATTATALNKLVSNPMFKLSAAQSLGSSFEEAKAAGATDEEALAAAVLTAGANAAVEVGGGIETLPGQLKGADLTSGAKAWNWVKSALDEGKEEVVQGAIQKFVEKGVYDNDKALFSTTDENAVVNPGRMMQEFGMGTAVGGILGGGQLVGDMFLNRGANTPLRQAEPAKANEPATAATQDVLVNQNEQTSPDTAVPSAKPNEAAPINPAEHRQTAAQILTDGIFDSATYGEALQDTGLKRADVRQALRDITKNVLGAERDPNVQTVLHAIENTDVAETQTPVETEVVQEPVQTVETDDVVEAKPAMGAADYGFSPYSNYQNTQSDFLPEGANAARPVDIPATDPMGRPTSRVASNLYGAQITTDDRRVQMELEFMQGAYGYDKKTNQAAVDLANETIKKDGYEKTYGRVTERLRDLKDLKQTMTEAILLYNDAIRNGKQEDAAELALLIVASGPEGGQLVQSFSMFRQLTPEGQLVGIQRVTDKINEKVYGKGKRKDGNPIPKYQQQEVENIINDARENALQQLEGKKPKASKNTIGSKLAAIIDKNKNPAPQKERTAEQKILKDLEAFAKTYMDKKEPKFEYSSAKALERFLSNQEEYEDAWNDARWELQEKYADNPEMLDALNDFVTNNMGLEQIEKGIDRDVAKALRVFGIKTSDLVKMSAEERANTANRVVRNLMMDSKLSAEDAAKARNFIIERFENRIAAAEERAAERAANRKHDPGLPVENWLDEIGNQVAAALDTAPKEQKPKPISKTIKQDVLRFVDKQYKPERVTQKRTMMDTLTDYFANREAYEQAWNSAKKASNQEAFSNAGDMLGGTGTDSVMAQAIVEEVAEQELKQKNINARMYLGDQVNLENQIADSIIEKTGVEKSEDQTFIREAVHWYLENKFDSRQTASSIDYAIRGKLSSKAVDGVKLKISDIIRKSPGDKAAVANKVAAMLVNDYGVSKEAAQTVSENIVKQFNNMVAESTETALKNRFGEKDKKQKKTFNQDFTELANMGAFTNANWKDAVTEKLFGHEITIDPKLVEQFRNAPDQQTRDTIMEQIYENVGHQIPTTVGEAANQWRYTSMLLAPSTHIKNMGGNLSMMAMKLGKDAVGAGLESATNAAIGAVNKVTNGKYGNTKIDRTKSILNVFSKNDQKLMQIAWDDFVNVEEDVKGIGKNKDNAMGKIGEYRDYWKINDPKSNAAKLTDKVLRAAESVPKANSNAMDIEDRIFSKPDYAISLAGYMKANNLTEITPEARLYAIKEAQKATFRDANPVSEFAKRAGNSNHKFWNGIVNAIFPFKGTPANVGVRAVEYSPAGFLTAIAKARKAAKDGTFKAADFIDDMSAAFVGSGLLVAGYFLAQNDWLRATGVGDEKEKAAQKEDGYKDHWFKLFGYSVPETVLTSASTPMFVGAALYEALATKALDGEAYTIDDVIQAFSTTIDPILGQTMLDGLSDVLYSVRSTQGGIGEYVGSIGINVAGNYLASFIPTLLSRISAAADGVSRETYTDKNKPLPKVQKEVQDLMMKTPLRTKLPEKVDNYGRTQENWLSGGDSAVAKVVGGIANVATPTFPSKIKTTDVGETLQELYRSGADTEGMRVFQTEAPKSFKADGKQVHLTSEQYETFEKSRGDNTMLYQGALQNDASFDAMERDAQIYATDKMYAFIDQKSKAELDVGYKPQDWVADLQGKSPEEVAEAIVEKTFEALAEDKERYENKYVGIGSLVESGQISDAVAATMLPEKQQTGYFENIQGSGISMDKYLDVVAYKAGEGIKQPEVKAYIEKNFSSKADRIRVWKCFYSENTIPDEW